MQQLSCIYQNYLFLKFLLYERQKCQYCSLFCRISILCGRIPYLSLFVLSLAVFYLQNQYSLWQDSIILVYLSSHWLFSICRISILCGRIPYLSLFVLSLAVLYLQNQYSLQQDSIILVYLSSHCSRCKFSVLLR